MSDMSDRLEILKILGENDYEIKDVICKGGQYFAYRISVF